jgi:hypothetical protein
MISKVKGQILVFEQVLIFGIAITIFITSFALFAMYQNYYVSSSVQDQLTGVKEYVLSNIIKICEKDDMNSSVVLPIPRIIGNNYYRISLNSTGLTVSMEGNISDFSPLYGLNEMYNFSGMVVSDLGKIVIYKYSNLIYICPTERRCQQSE